MFKEYSMQTKLLRKGVKLVKKKGDIKFKL